MASVADMELTTTSRSFIHSVHKRQTLHQLHALSIDIRFASSVILSVSMTLIILRNHSGKWKSVLNCRIYGVSKPYAPLAVTEMKLLNCRLWYYRQNLPKLKPVKYGHIYYI